MKPLDVRRKGGDGSGGKGEKRERCWWTSSTAESLQKCTLSESHRRHRRERFEAHCYTPSQQSLVSGKRGTAVTSPCRAFERSSRERIVKGYEGVGTQVGALWAATSSRCDESSAKPTQQRAMLDDAPQLPSHQVTAASLVGAHSLTHSLNRSLTHWLTGWLTQSSQAAPSPLQQKRPNIAMSQLVTTRHSLQWRALPRKWLYYFENMGEYTWSSPSLSLALPHPLDFIALHHNLCSWLLVSPAFLQ